MTISIIIVNYNTTNHLNDCLKSIIHYTVGLEYEIIVVDNNSPDREIESFPKSFQDVKFFFLSKNDGFGAGCDYGANQAEGKYLVFINPDITFMQNSLKVFTDYLESHIDVVLCSGILVNEKNQPIYSFNNFPDVKWEISEALLTNGDSKMRRILNSKNINIDAEPFEVDWAIGACMFTRKDIYDQIGGFDKNIFLYSEDVDLQMRLRKLGYKIVCLPNVRLRHYSKSSVRSDDGDNIYHLNMHKSKIQYMYKHFSILQRTTVRAAFIFGMIIRIFALPFREKFTGNKARKFNQLYNILKYYLFPRSFIKLNHKY